MSRNSDTDQNMIDFAKAIGRLEQGLADLGTHFTNHLSDHWKDRILTWCTMALQVVVIIMLGLIFFRN